MDKDIRILITGATGFIGSYLVRDLISRGYRNISIIVRKTSNISIFEKYNLNLIYADITNKKEVLTINESIDVIYHCAGYVGNKSKETLYKVNVVAVENICNLALKLKVKKLIHLSSVAVISGNLDVPLVEELPYKATNPYGESKLVAEKLVLRFRDKGLNIVIVRPCMVYGKGEPHLLSFIFKILKLGVFPLLNKGRAKFHLVYVKNVTDFLIGCMEKEAAVNNIFFIADKEVLTANQVFSIIAQNIKARKLLFF